MAATDGTPLRSARSARKVADPNLHTDEVENAAFTLHLDPDAAEGEAMVMGAAGNWEARPPAIPLLSTDPTAPEDGEIWVRKTVSATGTPIGLLLALTTTLYTRELSIFDGGGVYRTTLTVGA